MLFAFLAVSWALAVAVVLLSLFYRPLVLRGGPVVGALFLLGGLAFHVAAILDAVGPAQAAGLTFGALFAAMGATSLYHQARRPGVRS